MNGSDKDINFYEYTKGKVFLWDVEDGMDIDLLILDIKLDDAMGDQVAVEFRKKHLNTTLVFCSGFCLFLYVPQISLFSHFLWYVFNLCKPPKTNFDDLLFLFTFCKPIQANFKDSFLIFNMKSFEMLSTPRDLSNSSQIFKNCYKIHNI